MTAINATTFGFIKDSSLDGQFYCPSDKEYLADINKFNNKIWKAALPFVNKIIDKSGKIDEISKDNIP